MDVQRCSVVIDGELSSEQFRFPAVPRAGDAVRLSLYGDPRLFSVDSVVFVAAATFDDEPEGAIELRVSSLAG